MIAVMSNPASDPQDPAAPAADETPDPAVLRAERRLRLLEELAEIGMELARALKPGAAADGVCEDPSDDNAPGKGRDPADAYARLSRAIRLTLVLEAKTDQALRDLKSGVVPARQAQRAQSAKRADIAAARDLDDRRERVCHLVLRLVQAEFPSVHEFAALWETLEDRLEEDPAYFDIGERPLREIIERVCKDLKLTPDWSCLDGEELDDPPGRPRFTGHAPPPAPVPSPRLQPAAHHLE
jgi:hypothetical protein